MDGKNVWNLITGGPDTENPHAFYPFSRGPNLEGVISSDGRWKLHLPHQFRTLVRAGEDGKAGIYTNQEIGLSLFDLETDPLEKTNLLETYPDIAAKLLSFAEELRAALIIREKSIFNH